MTMTTKIIFFVFLFNFASSSLQQSDSSFIRCRRASSACILTPELTEGPYYWDTALVRQNISEDRAGIGFHLEVFVLNVDTCQPVSNAIVDLWHCDALGIYSHYMEASQNVQNPQNDNRTFLRGLQITNNDGIATFDTIFPGWYLGRTIHMHIKVHLGGTYNNATSLYSGGTTIHTGQLFFNDTFSDLVAQQSPYSSHTVARLLNSQDGIYAGGGSYTLMNVQYANPALGFSSGLITTVTLGITSSLLSSDTTTMPSNFESTEPLPGSSNGRVGESLFWFSSFLFIFYIFSFFNIDMIQF